MVSNPRVRNRTDSDDALSGKSPPDEIGGRVAELRKAQAMKVSELARQISVSPSLISQIERGQSRPSVATLFSLAEALDVPVDAFFRKASVGTSATLPSQATTVEAVAETGSGRASRARDTDHRYVVRHDDREAIDIEGGVRWERLTPTSLDDVEFLELVYAPRAESNASLYRHPGSEMLVVLSGRFHIYIGFDCYELSSGDSIYFPSSLPHRYVNPTDEVARGITLILRDDLRSHPSDS